MIQRTETPPASGVTVRLVEIGVPAVAEPAASAVNVKADSLALSKDAVTVQLYESWSRADQQILQPPVTPPAAALQSWWQAILQPHAPALSSMSSDRGRGSGNGSGGWFVDFGDNATTGLRLGGRHAIVIEPWQLVVGLSRGSADGSGKSAFFWPSDVGKAYEATAEGERPRGFAFWNIAEEGSGANGTSVPLSFAPSLNAFLHTRPGLL